MKRQEIWQAIEVAVRADKRNNSSFPDHPAGMAGKVVSKSGTLMKLCMEFKYTPEEYRLSDDVMKEQMKNAAVQTAAMAIRFLENLK